MKLHWLYNARRRGATHAFAEYESGVVRVAHCGVKRHMPDDANWKPEDKDAPYRCARCVKLTERGR